MEQSLSWTAQWQISKFRDPDNKIAEFMQNGGTLEEALKFFGNNFVTSEKWTGNLGLQEGRQELIDIICGLSSPTKWDNSNARIGVGDSNAAVADTQTGLQAASNKTWKAMDDTYPQRSAQTAEWRSTFGSDDGNHAWEEYTVVNAANDTGKNLNRSIASKGTKTSGETWTLSLKITFNAS